MTGIVDWNLKIVALMAATGSYTKAGIPDFVYRDDGVEALRVAENFRKWVKHNPTKKTGPRKFFDDLARYLKCAPNVTGLQLVQADIETFLDLIPPPAGDRARSAVIESRNRAEQSGSTEPAAVLMPEAIGRLVSEAVEGAGVSNDAIEISIGAFSQMRFLRQGSFGSVRKSLAAGRIDQKHHYTAPEAAEMWHGLVQADEYPTYEQCKSALRDLISSDAWRNAIADARPTTVVMLAGGGAPTKDLVLMRGLLQHPALSDEKITYYMIDSSPYMLMSSVWYLNEWGHNVTGIDRVTVEPLHADMLALADGGRALRSTGSILFGITGGTLGNVSEGAFLKSLNAMAEEGDLLIISADTVGDEPFEQIEKRLVAKYDHPQMRKFMTPALKSLIGELELGETISALLKRFDVRLERGKESGLSDIPGSISVRLSVTHETREITLISSTRYPPDDLVAFFGEGGWSFLSATPSPSNEHYVQFFFRKSPGLKPVISGARNDRVSAV